MGRPQTGEGTEAVGVGWGCDGVMGEVVRSEV